MNADWRSRYQVAVDAARAAGKLAKGYFDTTFEVEIKADNSPVTVADKAAEKLIREAVTKHFPNDGFLGEEFGDQPGGTGFRWVIDPIDGTKSFIRDIPLWGTLIGLEYKGEQIAGAVYMPCQDQMFHALKGNGAFRDETRIRVSDVADVSQAFLCYSSVGWFTKNGKERAFLDLAARTARQRGYGDFYGFMLVAQGSFDLMIDHSVHPWDVVGPKAIVEEAGGRFTDWKDNPTAYTPDVLASNGRLHAEAVAALR